MKSCSVFLLSMTRTVPLITLWFAEWLPNSINYQDVKILSVTPWWLSTMLLSVIRKQAWWTFLRFLLSTFIRVGMSQISMSLSRYWIRYMLLYLISRWWLLSMVLVSTHVYILSSQSVSTSLRNMVWSIMYTIFVKWRSVTSLLVPVYGISLTSIQRYVVMPFLMSTARESWDLTAQRKTPIFIIKLCWLRNLLYISVARTGNIVHVWVRLLRGVWKFLYLLRQKR